MHTASITEEHLDNPATPYRTAIGFLADPGDLSPPSSQGMPLASPSTTGANANGKRPLSTLDTNGEAAPIARNTATPLEPQKVKTHEQSGYTWVRQEDEPGWAWRNKRAVDEANRAYEGLLTKDIVVGNHYGDPFEMADRELALMKSQMRQ